MPEFLVKIADERGHVSQQVEVAPSESELRHRFTQQGLYVYWVKSRGVLSSALPFGGRRRVKTEQFLIFNQQFLTLIRAGLPILTSLDLLLRRQRNPFFKALLENVRDRVKSGESISEAFAAQGVFPKIYTTTLLAGEKSGNLEEVLNRYLVFQRLALSFRKKLLASLIYPSLLVVLVIGMMTFLITYVVPQFGELYKQLNTELPPMTVFMLSVGQSVQKYAIIIVAAILAALIGILRWRVTESGAQAIDRVRLGMPLIGDIWLKYQVAMFSRMLSTLLLGGIPLVPSLETAGESIQSRMIAIGVKGAAQRVREGLPLHQGLKDIGTFPELSTEMIEVGESTGALPQMLASVADFYEEDVENALTAAMSLIEPAILIVMGVVTAFILLSLYMPIFSIGAGSIGSRGGS